MAWRRAEVYEGGDEWESPVSRAEQLMKAYPDITVIRDMFGLRITQTFPDKWRHMWINVEHEKGSQRPYPTVVIQAYETPTRHYPTANDVLDIKQYGLQTKVKVHIQDAELVKPEVEYKERLRYPRDFSASYIRYIERYSLPISAHELVTTACKGLEMLKAYGEAAREQRERIDETHTGYHGWSQIVDTTKPDMDKYVAAVSPMLGRAMKHEGISYAHVGTKAIYALNALNKVTDAMLPSEMPLPPGNRREPRPRATNAPIPGRRPGGRT